MQTDKKASDKAFHVMCGDVVHSGHDNEAQATARAQQANDSAKAQGIKARYTVRPKP